MKEIPVFKAGEIVAVALVDDCNYDELAQYKWRLHSKGYACRSVKIDGQSDTILMHREVFNPIGFQIDHIDRNKLNNQKSNLREATNSQNQHNKGLQSNNKSGVPGVTWDSARNKWRVRPQLMGKFYNLGRFDSLDEATKVVVAWRQANNLG